MESDSNESVSKEQDTLGLRLRDKSLEPKSDHFEIKSTSNSGLGVYAVNFIPKGTILLETDSIPITVILKEYRREVCAQCFAYERGRNFKSRDASTNFSFCTQTCYSKWADKTSKPEYEAWTTIETFVRSKASKSAKVSSTNNLDAVDSDGDTIIEDEPQRPNAEEVEAAWNFVSGTAHFIRQARKGSKAKPHRRALNSALNAPADPDVLYFLLSGIICEYKSSDLGNEHDGNSWRSVLSLSPYATPYPSDMILKKHTYSYLQLLALLPEPLLDSVTTLVCRETVGRDAHNAFGIRSLEDEGSEFFGWGVWPEASYFNHSCMPNISKRRTERTWQFAAAKDLEVGEELFISYLGGEEATIDRSERNKSLKTWGFECACTKCLAEQQEDVKMN